MRNDLQKQPVKPRALYWLLFVVVGVILDLLTKKWANTSLLYGESVPILPGLNWTLVYNQGAAFSFLANHDGWQRWFFVAVSSIISIILFVWIRRTKASERLLRVGLVMVLTGAIGNLIDRLMLGYVVDFIHLYYKDYHWPIFNIADIFVSLGVVFIILSSLLESRNRKP